jgi:hypothetical protein
MRNRNARRRNRLITTVVGTIAACTMFASYGGIGFASGVINLAQYQYGKKVTICHKNKVTITVSVNAWPAHKRHGDTIGPCQPTGAAAGAAAANGSGSKGSGKKGSSGKGSSGKGSKGSGKSGKGTGKDTSSGGGSSAGNSSSTNSGSAGQGNGQGNGGNGNGNGNGKGKTK